MPFATYCEITERVLNTCVAGSCINFAPRSHYCVSELNCVIS